MGIGACDKAMHWMDKNMWYGVAAAGKAHPWGARSLVVPVALETVGKELLNPLAVITDTMLATVFFTGKILTGRTDGTVRHWMWIDMKGRMPTTLFHIGAFLVSPLIALVRTIIAIWDVIYWPERAGRKRAAWEEHIKFVQDLVIARQAQKRNATSGKRDDFWPPCSPCAGLGAEEFEKELFAQYQTALSEAQTGSDFANLHFLDSKVAVDQLKTEISTKCQIIKQAWFSYKAACDALEENKEAPFNKKKAAQAKLYAMWGQIQQQVLHARSEVLVSVKLEPDINALLEEVEAEIKQGEEEQASQRMTQRQIQLRDPVQSMTLDQVQRRATLEPTIRVFFKMLFELNIFSRL